MKRASLLLLAACHSSASTSTTASASASTTASAPTSTSAPTPTPTSTASQTPTPLAAPHTVTLAPHGVGFDDIVFAPGGRSVLVPGGATGKLFAIDLPSFMTATLAAGEGAASPPPYSPGHHDDGITSVAETPTFVAVTDRTRKTLAAFSAMKLDKRVSLAAAPDYVRWVAPTSEVWVTEPDASQIEVFSTALAPVAKIQIAGGPESLVVSNTRKAAYANLWHKQSVEIDLTSRAIKRTFDSGCEKTRGIALDDVTGSLFVACNDGRVAKVDLGSGKVAAEGRAGDGLDIIDWSPATGHLYAPAARAGTMTVFDAALRPLATVPVPKGAHCVAADDQGNAWVCDPDHGAVIGLPDPKRPEK